MGKESEIIITFVIILFFLMKTCVGSELDPYAAAPDYNTRDLSAIYRNQDTNLDISDGILKIRTPQEQRFLEGLIMEAGRHFLFPEKEQGNSNAIEENAANTDVSSYFEGEGQPEYIDLGMQRTSRASEPLTGQQCPTECHGFSPVCSNQRKVYESECQLRKENCGSKNITVSDWENCRGKHYLCPSACLDINDPVCGQDGKIYHNMCILRKRNCGKLLEVQPLKYCYARRQAKVYGSCPEDCQEIYNPVCASDGSIYYNECFLKMRTCGDDVKIVELEQCAQISRCPEICLPLYDPVCGSDGKLYINHCRMLQQNCGNEIKRMSRNFCMNFRKSNAGETI